MANALQKARDFLQGKSSIQINNNSLAGRLLGLGEKIGSGAARSLTNAQLGFERLNQAKRYELPSLNTPYQGINLGVNYLAKPIAESVINIPRNVVVGGSRIGTELGGAAADRRRLDFLKLAQGAAPMAEGLFDAYTMGFGGAAKSPAVNLFKQVGREATETGIKQAIKSGAIGGVKAGTFGGLTYGLDTQYGQEFNPKQLATNVLAGGAIGAIAGGAFGGLGAVKGLLTKSYTKETTKQLRDKAGRWVAGEVPVKPPKMPKAAWEYQLKVNRTLGRNPYEIVTPKDAVKYMNIEANKRAGLQIRDVNLDKSPLYVTQPTKGGIDINRTWYHGTRAKFDKFEHGHRGVRGVSGKEDTHGFYFSPLKETAKNFAGENGDIKEVKLDIKNPKIAKSYLEIGTLNKEKIEQAIKEGYDGYYFKPSPEDIKSGFYKDYNEEMVAFYPEQIKNTQPLSPTQATKGGVPEGGINWRKGFESTTDEFRQKDILKAVANGKSTPKELTDVLDKLDVNVKQTGAYDIAYDVSKNPAATAEIKSRALKLYESGGMVSPQPEGGAVVTQATKGGGEITLYRGTTSNSRTGGLKENLKENMYLTPSKENAMYYAKLSADRVGAKPVVHEFKFNPSEVEEIGNTGEWRFKGFFPTQPTKGGGEMGMRLSPQENARINAEQRDFEFKTLYGGQLQKEEMKAYADELSKMIDKGKISPEQAGNMFLKKYPMSPTQPTKGVTGVDLPPPQSTSQGLEPVGNILSRQEVSASKQLKSQQPSIPEPQVKGAGQSNGASDTTIDPVQKIINALAEAKPLNQKQRQIYSQIRSQQAGALGGIGEQMGGEAGYYKKLGQLKGELPKVEFESIRKSLTQDDINSLFNKVEQSNLGVFEKVNAQTALRKLLGEGGGSVPTKSELKLLNEVFPPEFVQAVLNNRSSFQKLLDIGKGVINLPRAVMATADFSAPLRQGVFLVGRPKQWIPAFKEQFRYFANPKAYEGLLEDIKKRPNAKLYREAGLSITDMSPVLGSREEMFMSTLTEKIPGFGKLAAGSNRAYSGFLNKLRVDVFDDLIKSAKSQDIEMDGKALKDLGKFINSATGRGDLGSLNRAAPVLNGLLFSPRLVASRINLLNPAFYGNLDPFVRKEALKSLLTFGGTAMTVMGLAKLGGAEVGADPRSADFGKIKTGNTRYDILGGFQQYIKLAAQLLTGKIVSSTTGKEITLGEGYKPLTRKDILIRFFEGKESPFASFLTGLLTGKTGLGEDFKLSEEIVKRFIPLVAQDMYELQKEYGASGFLRGVPGIFGVGSQTYGRQEVVTGKNALGQSDVQISPVTGLAEDIVAKLGGQREIGSTAQYSADAYYKQLKQMPKDQAKAVMLQIAKLNPDVAKKILTAAEDEKKGITVKDKELKAKGVKNGERAIAIVKQLNKIKEKEKKKAYLLDLVRKGVVTEEVLQQVLGSIKQ